MRSIMVDNWFMEDVVEELKSIKYEESQSLKELLLCIMLWDEIYYPKNKHNWWNTVPSEVQNHLIGIDDSKETGLDWSLRMEGYFEGYCVDMDDWVRMKKCYPTKDDVINAGALRYMRLSHLYGCDYMPCSSRRNYINSIQSSGASLVSKIDFQSHIDNEIKEIYIDTFKEVKDLIPKPVIEMPLITDYIFKNRSNNMSPIDYAMHLKNENKVVKYREYLDALSNAIENHNIFEFKYLIDISKEVVSEVIETDKKGLLNTKFRISFFPSALFKMSIGGFDLTAGVNPVVLEMGYKTQQNNSKFQLSFLKELTEQLIKT